MSHDMSQADSSIIRNPKDRDLQDYDAQYPKHSLPAMELEIVYRPRRVTVGYSASGRGDFRYTFQKFQNSPIDPRHGNPFFTLAHFLDVRSPGEALDFLSMTGTFVAPNVAFPQREETLTWSDFRLWQQLMRVRIHFGPITPKSVIRDRGVQGGELAIAERFGRIIRNSTPRELNWLRGHPSGIIIVRKAIASARLPMLCAQICVTSTLEAMLATSYIDLLRGLNFAQCKLPECANLFLVTRRGGIAKEYCCHKHAHTANVRKLRAALKSAPGAARRKRG